MITGNTRIQIGSNALIQKVSDEMVILDSQSGQYYTLNNMATEMLDILNSGSSVEQVVAQICKEYEAEQEEVLNDISAMIQTLHEKELVTLQGSE
jgi:PqqD family protein of HPr-rel-A system